jgi:hypothetical protein
VLAEDAIKAAIKDYRNKHANNKKWYSKNYRWGY